MGGSANGPLSWVVLGASTALAALLVFTYIHGVPGGFGEQLQQRASHDLASREPRLAAADPSAGEKNLVVIKLESVSVRALGAYGGPEGISPFMDSLAQESLIASRAYTTVPHTGKALVSANCGVYPPPHTLSSEAAAAGLPAPCLAELLKERGYEAVRFSPASAPSPPNLAGGGSHKAENLGYSAEDPKPPQAPTEGYEKANYFSYEDTTMLEPSGRWLGGRSSEPPFFATYNTSSAHHPYNAPARYGRIPESAAESNQAIADSREQDYGRYLDSVHYLDGFLGELFAQYKRAGLYEDTVFVLYSDHGESFGEHSGPDGSPQTQHDAVLHDEVTRVPLIVHAPGEEGARGRVRSLASTMDILPTAAELLGYELRGEGAYSGESLLSLDGPLGGHLSGLLQRRILYMSCWPPVGAEEAPPRTEAARGTPPCVGSVDSSGMKYIRSMNPEAPEGYTEEYYDLHSDPGERENLAEGRASAVNEAASSLIDWYRDTSGGYDRLAGRTTSHSRQ